MQVDALFDFLNGRIKEPPKYWINGDYTPLSISGGYIMVMLTYEMYSNLRSYQN
jgi:hypothetical protein